MKYAKEGQNLTWNALTENNYWTVRLMEVRLGDYVFNLDTRQAIIDTGTSYILIPPDDFEEFKAQVSIGRRCFTDAKSNLFACSCITDMYSDFPEFTIRLGENIYKMPPESYIQIQQFKCYFKVLPQHFAGSSYWLLGDAFMMNYYTIFDLDKKAVGFVGSVNVLHRNRLYDLFIVVAFLVAVGAIIMLLMSWYREWRMK